MYTEENVNNCVQFEDNHRLALISIVSYPLGDKKNHHRLSVVVLIAWRLPTLPGPFGPSTIGARGLNGRVRDGYVWNPSAIATKRSRLILENWIRNLFCILVIG